MELQNLLREGIDQWISRKPRQRSIHALAKRSGVKYSTLINVYNFVLNPPVEKLVPVLIIVFGNEKTKQVISDYRPELLEAFTQILGAHKSNPTGEDDALYELLDRRENFIVYLHCLTTGVDKQRIQNKYGNTYLRALKDLFDAGLIKYDNGKFIATKEYISFPSAKKALSFTPHLLEMFDDEHVGNGANAFLFAENVSREDLESIKRLQEDYNKRLKKILDKSDPDGNLCWFSTNISNFVDLDKNVEVDL